MTESFTPILQVWKLCAEHSANLQQTLQKLINTPANIQPNSKVCVNCQKNLQKFINLPSELSAKFAKVCSKLAMMGMLFFASHGQCAVFYGLRPICIFWLREGQYAFLRLAMANMHIFSHDHDHYASFCTERLPMYIIFVIRKSKVEWRRWVGNAHRSRYTVRGLQIVVHRLWNPKTPLSPPTECSAIVHTCILWKQNVKNPVDFQDVHPGFPEKTIVLCVTRGKLVACIRYCSVGATCRYGLQHLLRCG